MKTPLSELTLPVRDMPNALRIALHERGFTPGNVMTMADAFAEYTAWHLGDRTWGTDFVRLAEDFHQAAT